MIKRRLEQIEKQLRPGDEVWFVNDERATESISKRSIDKPTPNVLESLQDRPGVHLFIEDVPLKDDTE